MTVEIISWSISTKVWDRAGIELATPGSAVRLASVARHVTDCATRPGRLHLWQPHTIYSLQVQDQIPTMQTCNMFTYNIFNVGNGEGCLGYICGNHTQSTAFWHRTKYLQYKHVICLSTTYLMLGMVRDVSATFAVIRLQFWPYGSLGLAVSHINESNCKLMSPEHYF